MTFALKGMVGAEEGVFEPASVPGWARGRARGAKAGAVGREEQEQGMGDGSRALGRMACSHWVEVEAVVFVG